MPIGKPSEGTELIITPETAPAGPQPRPDIQESLPYDSAALQAAEAAEKAAATTAITELTEMSAEEIKKLQEEADRNTQTTPTYGDKFKQ